MCRRLVVWCLVAGIPAVVPVPSAAQGRQALAGATVQLVTAMEGRVGDEGPAVLAALAAMTRALETWDRDLRQREQQIRDAMGNGTPAAQVTSLSVAYGRQLLERGRVDDALQALDRAIQIDPRQSDAHFLRGLAYGTRDPDRAVDAFRQAWTLDRENPVKAYWLVQASVDNGDLDRLDAAADALAAAYRRLVETRGARAARPFPTRTLFLDAAADRPIFPLVRYQDGFARIVRGNYDGALASLRTAAERDPLVADPALRSDVFLKGVAALRAGRLDEAVVLIERAADRASDSAEVRRVLGLALRAAGRLDESLTHLDLAVELDPYNERAHLARASVIRTIGSSGQLEGALQQALRMLPASGALRWNSAMHHERANRSDEMLQQLEAVPTASVLAGRRQIFNAIGRLHATGNRGSDALRPLRQSARVAPNHPAAHLGLGAIYHIQGHAEPALAAFVAALLIEPAAVEAHTGIGQIHLSAGHLDDALAAFTHAVRLRPDHQEARYGLATTLVRLGRAEEARTHLAAFRRLQQARLATMRDAYELLKLDRDAALHDDAGRYQEAISIRQQLVARAPGNLQYRSALAESLVRMGRLDAAVEQLEQAAAANIASADTYRRLAELYAALERTGESARAHAEYLRRRDGAMRQAESPTAGLGG